jgi:hypothetical protein
MRAPGRSARRSWSRPPDGRWVYRTPTLERAIQERLAFAFEITLGGKTVTRRLAEAAERGIKVLVWYVGLACPELHIERVAARVRRGGHSIPEETIRRRWNRSRLNLVHLLPLLRELRVNDNTEDADPSSGETPLPRLLLHLRSGRIVGPADLSQRPDWAKPIVAEALQNSHSRS